MKVSFSLLLTHLRARSGLRRLRKATLFDAGWYLQAYPDVRAAGVDPGLHYLQFGAAEGRDPGPGFSTSGYHLQGWHRQGWRGTDNPLLYHIAHPGEFTALPVFAGTGPQATISAVTSAPVILFCGHQALGQQFGAERSFLTMLERAAQAGLAVHVLLPHCLDPDYLAACRARARAVHLIPYGWRRAGMAPHAATIAALTALIRTSGTTAVHQNTAVPDAPLIAARAAGVPSVLHLRELPDRDAELCARLGQDPQTLRAVLLDQADRFVANSDTTARWIDPQGNLPPGRVVVQSNAVDPALFDLPFAPQTPLRVALIGSNTAKKGVSDALAVARRAAAHGLGVQIVLIGPPSADLAALGPLPTNVRLAGYAPGPVAAMVQADVVLCLSHFAESFGRTVFEAMAAGRPVIAYDRGHPPVLIGTGDAGIVVPADDAQAVVRALQRLVGDAGLLQAMSQAARLRAADLRDDALLPDARLYSDFRDCNQVSPDTC